MSRVSRREALISLGAAAIGPSALLPPVSAPARHSGGDVQPPAVDVATLLPLAEVTLPSELGEEGRRAAVSAFLRWIRSYKEGADTDHGYGNTRIRATGPSPARNYPAQLTALDEAARRAQAASFAQASPDVRRTIVTTALTEARIERLPARPTGAHIAADLMGHYFTSPAALDLCYRAAIGRDACRGLPGSEERPAPLTSPTKAGA